MNYEITNKKNLYEAELIFRHLTLKTSTGKILLNDISGKIEPGTMVALMGSSGAGKTTLLNCLTGRLDDNLYLTGDIRVNNRKRNAVSWPNISAYVSQVFYAYENMTVEETLEFACKIHEKRLLEHKNSEYACNNNSTKVNELLKVLGLNLVRRSLVKQLSGGERIRLSVGIELIGNPSIIFLDESLSGVDSFNAAKILKFLMNLAKEQRKTLIVTIHQPSYKMVQYFDKIFLMAKGGVVFDGTVGDCVEFFKENGLAVPKNTNPTDFFLDEIAVFDKTSLGKVNDLKENFKKYAVKNISYDYELNNNLIDRQVEYTHCCSLKLVLFDIFKRNLKDNFRNKSLILVKLFYRISIAFLVSSVYWMLGKKEIMNTYSFRGIFSFVSSNELFGICGPLFNLFQQEQKIIMRERRSGMYSGYSSYVAKFMSEMVFLFCIEFPYLTIIYCLTGFFLSFGQFMQFIVILLCEVAVGVTLGCTVSIIAPTINSAQAIGFSTAIMFKLFSGSYNNPEKLARRLKWLIYASPMQYTFRGVLLSQSKNRNFSDGSRDLNSKELLESFGLNGLNYTSCVFLTLVCALILGILGAIILHKQTKSKVNKIQK